jgi:hypothetical protein
MYIQQVVGYLHEFVDDGCFDGEVWVGHAGRRPPLITAKGHLMGNGH